jgi:hypothetical protein
MAITGGGGTKGGSQSGAAKPGAVANPWSKYTDYNSFAAAFANFWKNGKGSAVYSGMTPQQRAWADKFRFLENQAAAAAKTAAAKAAADARALQDKKNMAAKAAAAARNKASKPMGGQNKK